MRPSQTNRSKDSHQVNRKNPHTNSMPSFIPNESLTHSLPMKMHHKNSDGLGCNSSYGSTSMIFSSASSTSSEGYDRTYSTASSASASPKQRNACSSMALPSHNDSLYTSPSAASSPASNSDSSTSAMSPSPPKDQEMQLEHGQHQQSTDQDNESAYFDASMSDDLDTSQQFGNQMYPNGYQGQSKFLNCRGHRFFPDDVVHTLTRWFDENQNYPYPDENMTNALAKEANISAKQVRKWFANKRVRSHKCYKQTYRSKKEAKVTGQNGRHMTSNGYEGHIFENDEPYYKSQFSDNEDLNDDMCDDSPSMSSDVSPKMTSSMSLPYIAALQQYQKYQVPGNHPFNSQFNQQYASQNQSSPSSSSPINFAHPQLNQQHHHHKAPMNSFVNESLVIRNNQSGNHSAAAAAVTAAAICNPLAFVKLFENASSMVAFNAFNFNAAVTSRLLQYSALNEHPNGHHGSIDRSMSQNDFKFAQGSSPPASSAKRKTQLSNCFYNEVNSCSVPNGHETMPPRPAKIAQTNEIRQQWASNVSSMQMKSEPISSVKSEPRKAKINFSDISDLINWIYIYFEFCVFFSNNTIFLEIPTISLLKTTKKIICFEFIISFCLFCLTACFIVIF